MPTVRWISQTRHLSEWLSEKASGGSSRWTATISRSIAFTDGSASQSSHRRTPEYGLPLTRSGRPCRIAQHGYLWQIRSSRRLETECKRNVEVMWLLGRLVPDYRSIVESRRMVKHVCHLSVWPRSLLASYFAILSDLSAGDSYRR